MSRHVLIVEDEENIVESLSFLLEREGYRVTSVLDGAQALPQIEAGRPDVLILDVMLPGLDGFEILRAIRSDAAFSDLPVIMLTAKSEEDNTRIAAAIAVNALPSTPFSLA